MTDIVSPEVRSRMMRAIGPRNTQPEMRVRRFLHAAGLRYRLHVPGLPGKPDIVLPKYKCVIFVHGCFWHRHPGCRYATTPATRQEFWSQKFQQNVLRDERVRIELAQAGWRVFVIWECETKDIEIMEALVQDIRGTPTTHTRHCL